MSNLRNIIIHTSRGEHKPRLRSFITIVSDFERSPCYLLEIRSFELLSISHFAPFPLSMAVWRSGELNPLPNPADIVMPLAKHCHVQIKKPEFSLKKKMFFLKNWKGDTSCTLPTWRPTIHHKFFISYRFMRHYFISRQDLTYTSDTYLYFENMPGSSKQKLGWKWHSRLYTRYKSGNPSVKMFSLKFLISPPEKNINKINNYIFLNNP